jgi:cytochrome c-type biogenesis protein CcmH/NrfG
MTQAWYRLARAYERIGNRPRAAYCRKTFKDLSDYQLERSSLEERTRLRLDDAQLRLQLARIYVRGGEFARALNQYAVCLRLSPQNAAARKERGQLEAMLRQSGEMPKAETFNALLTAAAKQPLPPAR